MFSIDILYITSVLSIYPYLYYKFASSSLCLTLYLLSCRTLSRRDLINDFNEILHRYTLIPEGEILNFTAITDISTRRQKPVPYK